MELEDFKHAWQSIDRRLEQQHAMSVQLFRDARLDKMHRGLRPLVWGQAFQIVCGVLGLLVLAPIWVTHWRNGAVLVSGLVVHAYCIGLIIIGAMVESQIARLDYGAPVVSLQRQLTHLRRTYAVRGALFLGLPWWFLSAPLLVVLSRGEIMRSAPSAIWSQLAVGAVGLAATAWFYRWAQQPERAGLARRIDESTTGGSLRRAQAALDEIDRFTND